MASEAFILAAQTPDSSGPPPPMLSSIGLLGCETWRSTVCRSSGEVFVAVAAGNALHVVRTHGILVCSVRCPDRIAQISVARADAVEQRLQLAVCSAEGRAFLLHDAQLCELQLPARVPPPRWKEVHFIGVAGRLVLLGDACVCIVDVLHAPAGGGKLVPRELVALAPSQGALACVERWSCDGTFARIAASAVADLNFAAFGQHKCHVFLNAAVFGRGAPRETLKRPPENTGDKLAFLPAIPVKVSQSQILAAEWQLLGFTSVLLLIARRGALLTALLYSVTRTGDFAAAPTFQCLLSRAIALPSDGLGGLIPISSSDPEHAPHKVRMFCFDRADGTLRTATTRFSRFSAPIADRGYELRTAFPAEWGAPVAMRALPVNRRRRTMLSRTNITDVDLSSRVEAVVQFSRGPLVHALFDPSQQRWAVESILAVRAGCAGVRVVGAAPHPQLPLLAALCDDGTVSLHHTELGCILATRRLGGPTHRLAAPLAGNAKIITDGAARPVALYFDDGAPESLTELVVCYSDEEGTPRVAAVARCRVNVAIEEELAHDGDQVRGVAIDFRVGDALGGQRWVPPLPALYTLDPESDGAARGVALPRGCTAVTTRSGAVFVAEGEGRVRVLAPDGAVLMESVDARLLHTTGHGHSSGLLAFERAGDVSLLCALSPADGTLRSVISSRDGGLMVVEPLSLPRGGAEAIAAAFLPTPCVAVVWPDAVRLYFPSTTSPLAWSDAVAVGPLPATICCRGGACFTTDGALLVKVADGPPLLIGPLRGRPPPPAVAIAASTGSPRKPHIDVSDANWFCAEASATPEGDAISSGVACCCGGPRPGAIAVTCSGLLTWAADDRLRASVRTAAAAADVSAAAIVAHINACDWRAVAAVVTALSDALRVADSAATSGSPTLQLSRATPLTSIAADSAFADHVACGPDALRVAPPSARHLLLSPAEGAGVGSPLMQPPPASVTAADFFISGDTLQHVVDHLPAHSVAALDAADQMRLLAVLQVLQQDVVGTAGSVDRAALPLLFQWKLGQLLDRAKLANAAAGGDELRTSATVPPAVVWALFSETQEKLADIVTQNGAALSWALLRRSSFALWVKSPILLRKTVEALGKGIFTATRSPKACALYYVLAGKVSMLAALCKAVNNPRLEQFFARDFGVDKNRSAASANAFAAMGKGDVLYGAAFFVLAGEAATAAKVILQRERDWQLALLVLRLAAGDATFTAATASDFLTSAAEADVKLSSAARCCVLWRSGQHIEAAQQLWHCDDPSFTSILPFAVRHTPTLALRRSEVLPRSVEASMLAAAARQCINAGIDVAALRCFTRLRVIVAEELAVCAATRDGGGDAAAGKGTATAAPLKAAAPAVADFASGQIALRMDSDDSDNDVPASAFGSAEAAAGASPPTAAVTERAIHEAQLAMWGREVVLYARELAATWASLASDGGERDALLSLAEMAAARGETRDAPTRVEAAAAANALEAEAARALQVATTFRDRVAGLAALGCHSTATTLARQWTPRLWNVYRRLVLLGSAKAAVIPLPEQHWSLLSATCFHVLCTIAATTRDIGLALALMTVPLPLVDIVTVGEVRSNATFRAQFLEYHQHVADTSSKAARDTRVDWQAQHEATLLGGGPERPTPPHGATGAEQAALRHLFVLFEAAASRHLRQAVMLRKLSSSNITSVQLLLLAALCFYRSVDAVGAVCGGCCGSREGVPDAIVNGIVVQQRKEWVHVLRLVSSFPVPSSLGEAAGSDVVPRFFYRLARILCADVLHTTEQLPHTFACVDQRAHDEARAATAGNRAAAALAALLVPPSPPPGGSPAASVGVAPLEELEYHHAQHVATTQGVQRMVLDSGARRGELLSEQFELCPRQRAVVHSVCIDQSTLDNVAIAMGNSCRVFHGHRELLVTDDDDVLARSLHERNHATSAFASGTDSSVCCTVDLEEHSARLLVSHPHLPVFLSGGSAGGITLHQFGNPHATVRIRNNSYRGVLSDVVFSANGYMYAATDNGGTVTVWRCASDAASITPVMNLKCFQDALGVAFIGHRTTMLAAVGQSLTASSERGQDASVKLLDALIGRAVSDVRLPAGFEPHRCYFLNDEDALLVVARQGTALLYDTRGGRVRTRFSLQQTCGDSGGPSSRERFTCTALSAYGDLFAAGNSNGDVMLWALADIVAAQDNASITPLGRVGGMHASRSTARVTAASATTSICFSPAALVSAGSSGAVVAMPIIPATLRSMA